MSYTIILVWFLDESLKCVFHIWVPPWIKNIRLFCPALDLKTYTHSLQKSWKKKKKKKSWKVYVMFLPEDHIKINLYITEI